MKRYNVQFVRRGSNLWEPDSYLDDLHQAGRYVENSIKSNPKVVYGRIIDSVTNEVVLDVKHCNLDIANIIHLK